MFATFTVNEAGGPPNAIYNITCLGLKGRDVAPFGLGLPPSSSLPGRIRNRILEFLAPNVVFRGVSKALAEQCRLVGVSPRKFDGPAVSPYLYLQPSVPAFEYPRPDLPPQVHYVGALLPDPPGDVALPNWWPEMLASTRPVVLVTQGTVATSVRDLVAPTIEGLADDDVLVIAAGVRDKSALGLARLPDNARVEEFVPFKPLLQHVDAFVTNGGYGGVQFALSAGVPIVAAGKTEDKPEIGNRVAYSGVGVNLKTAAPRPDQVARAVRTLLHEPLYRQRAALVQRDLREHDAPAGSADLLERLATSQAPVLR